MNADELSQLIRDARETRRVELKASMNWVDLSTRAKVVKAALAFANTPGGGILIFGLEETGTPSQHKLVGMPEVDWNSFDPDQVAAVVNSHAAPPIDLSIERMEVDGSRVVALIIREFSDFPVVCTVAIQLPGEKYSQVQKGRIYCRSRRAPETTEIQSPDDLREIVRLATEKELGRYLRLRAQEAEEGPSDAELFRSQLGGWAT